MNKRMNARCMSLRIRTTWATVLPVAWGSNRDPTVKCEQRDTSRWRRALAWWLCGEQLCVVVRCPLSERERKYNSGIKNHMSAYTQTPKGMMHSENLQRLRVARE